MENEKKLITILTIIGIILLPVILLLDGDMPHLIYILTFHATQPFTMTYNQLIGIILSFPVAIFIVIPFVMPVFIAGSKWTELWQDVFNSMGL